MKSTYIDQSQETLLPKLQKYLESKNRSQGEIIKLGLGGYCSGLSSLFLLCISNSVNPLSPSIEKDSKILDLEWFNFIVKSIAAWDEKTVLSPVVEEGIDELLTLINRYQDEQGNLDKCLKNTLGETPRREYSIAGCFKAEALTNKSFYNSKVQENYSLIKILTQPYRLVFISGIDHDMGLFFDGEFVNFYDAYKGDGVKYLKYSSSDLEKLVIDLFTANSYDPDVPSPLGFRIFTFDQQPGTYPSQDQVLGFKDLEIETSTLSGYKYAEGQTSLHLAAKINCSNSIQFYLKQITKIEEINALDNFGETPFYIATSRGHLAATKIFLDDARVNYNIQNENGMTPLLNAISAGNYELVEMLLSNPRVDVNLADADGITPILCAVYLNDVKMVQTLLEKASNLHWTDQYEQLISSSENEDLKTLLRKHYTLAHPQKVSSSSILGKRSGEDPEDPREPKKQFGIGSKE